MRKAHPHKDELEKPASALRLFMRGPVISRLKSMLASSASLLAILTPTGVLAQAAPNLLDTGNPLADAVMQRIASGEILVLCISLGSIVFAVFTGVSLVRARSRLETVERTENEKSVSLQRRLERAEATLGLDNAAVLIWDELGRPEMVGRLTGVAAEPKDVSKLLDFGSWLTADSQLKLDTHIRTLRSTGETFGLVVQARDGREFTVDGRFVSSRALVRIQPVSGYRKKMQELEDKCVLLGQDVKAFQQLCNTLPFPIWQRALTGEISWSNPAFEHANKASSTDVHETFLDGMLPSSQYEALKSAIEARKPFEAQVETSVTRRAGDEASVPIKFVSFPSPTGTAGYALNLANTTHIDGLLEKQASLYLALLNELTAGVAMFGPDRRLSFANRAFCSLFGLSESEISPGNEHGYILDILREKRQIPEVVDYRRWKNEQLSAYQSESTQQPSWYLPDGRTIRIVSEKVPSGGLLYLFEDQTERLAMESQYNAAMRVQRETLENMTEGVAVFGTDGRLKFFNPAFVDLWELEGRLQSEQPHIEDIAKWCATRTINTEIWESLVHAVTDLPESRVSESGRLSKKNGETIEFAVMPLPDGATLTTFINVSSAVNVERALRERNEALLAADRIKDEFIQHVSYELRTPLTSVIGFAELMDAQSKDTLSSSQIEYLSAILSSSKSLLSIVDNILDIASIDAGTISLSFETVNPSQITQDAVGQLADRVKEAGVKLVVSVDPNLPEFIADPQRVRQIIFNLLSNAVGFSEPNSTVSLAFSQSDSAIILEVSDQAQGIPPEQVDAIFDRFMSRTKGTRHRGAGLGLSLVKSLVELHEGNVEIKSAVGEGTTVTCVFPKQLATKSEAAE